MGWVGLGWVENFRLAVGWVGLGPSSGGSGWVGSEKMDPWTTLGLRSCQSDRPQKSATAVSTSTQCELDFALSSALTLNSFRLRPLTAPFLDKRFSDFSAQFRSIIGNESIDIDMPILLGLVSI